MKNSALNLIGQGYDEIRKANQQKRQEENKQEFSFSGGVVGEDGKVETGNKDIAEMTNKEKDATIETLAGAVMELTQRLDALEGGK